jgi:hypothetical protein
LPIKAFERSGQTSQEKTAFDRRSKSLRTVSIPRPLRKPTRAIEWLGGTACAAPHCLCMAQPRKKAVSSPNRARTTRGRDRRPRSVSRSRPAPLQRARRAKFLRYFPKGFHDATYVDWERDYKWAAHLQWQRVLGREAFRDLLAAGEYKTIAAHAVAIEARTNLLFSFEKMALRDAVKGSAGARAFAQGLYDFLYGDGDMQSRFERWVATVARLPRRQTRVLTWPLTTVFGFIALPSTHFFLKPTVTRLAAQRYGLPLDYRSRPNWETYRSLLMLARTVRRDLADLRPRDMIDIQSFLWVQGSDEYPE